MNKHMLDVMRERKLARPEKAKLLDVVEKAKKRRLATMEKTKKQELAMMKRARNEAKMLPPLEVLEEWDLMNKHMLDMMREWKLARPKGPSC